MTDASAPHDGHDPASAAPQPGVSRAGIRARLLRELRASLRAAVRAAVPGVAVALGALSAMAAPAAAQGDDEPAVPPIQAVDDTYVLNFAQTDEEGMSLFQFVQACQQVTEYTFVIPPDTESLLKTQNVRLIGSKTIQKERFYSFFQVMMIISKFVCTEVGEDDIAVIRIDSLDGQQRGNLRSGAVYVEEDDLDDYRDQPATLITTVVTLPNTDVRQVSNSMRTIITDANTQQMLPAGNSNSMVLVGFGSSVVAMAEMLRIIDEASKLEVPTPVFDMVRLEYALAEDIQPIIEELLEADNQTRQAQRQARQAAGAIAGQDTDASITVDPRLNALLITALPEQMPRIKELIARLDVDIVERERSYHIYALENVKAEELAEVLNEFLEDAAQLDPTGGANAGRGGQAPRSNNNTTEFVVVADPETNALLVAANRSRYQELSALIEQLDRRQDQVLIETALVELSSQDFLDIGVELGFADIPGTGEDGGAGVTSFGLSTLQDTDGDGIFDLRQPNVSTGATAAIIDGGDFSIPALLSLLQTKDNSNVLNIPSVLVNNNSPATVETQELQPTTTITANGVGGQTQENFNDYVEAGITMQISPSISASRYLRLEIYLQVSNFIGVVQTGTIPPPQTTRTLTTQVNVPDGATMVIGGIVIDNETESRDQVPLLGDIPILGYLFSRDQKSRQRTVLYFFVTPHILQDKDFADLAEVSFQKKLEMTGDIGIDRMRRVDPNFGKDEDRQGGVTLEGFNLPLYQAPPRGEVQGEELGLTPVEATRRLDEAQDND